MDFNGSSCGLQMDFRWEFRRSSGGLQEEFKWTSNGVAYYVTPVVAGSTYSADTAAPDRRTTLCCARETRSRS